MVLTHVDLDHIAGVASVFGALEVGTLCIGRFPPGTRWSRLRQWRGLAWECDGVRFAFLNPPPGARVPSRANDLSCVLRVEAGGRAMLRSGDSERRAEAALAEHPGELRAQALQVLHHGSRSSCRPGFLAAARPAVAIVSAG